MRVALIDSQNIAHIVFHAMGHLSHYEMQTGVVFGFISKIIQLADELGTNKFVFCWDSPVNIRKRLFAGYKDREKSNTRTFSDGTEVPFSVLVDQMFDIRQNILPRLGFFNNIMYYGLEADDVIALIIRNGELPKSWRPADFIIVSADKDLYQLLSDRVSIYNTRKKSMYTYLQFTKEYGIPAEQWADAKAYGGCVSDTVPGIRGIADPAKSTSSNRALRYLRGDATKKTREYIECAEGQAVYKRNIKLVRLPFVRGIRPIIRDNVFEEREWLAVFDQYGFESLLTRKKLAKIRSLFKLVRW